MDDIKPAVERLGSHRTFSTVIDGNLRVYTDPIQSMLMATNDEVEELRGALKKACERTATLENSAISISIELHNAYKKIEGLEYMLLDMEGHKDEAYLERNKVVAALAKCFPSGIGKTEIVGWSEDWHNCVYIDLPTGQVSWHFHDSQSYLFDSLTSYTGVWDGHTTQQKYGRLAKLDRLVGPPKMQFHSRSEEKIVELLGQGACDGTVEAFEVNGKMVVPSAEGVTYISKADAMKFFGLVEPNPT